VANIRAARRSGRIFRGGAMVRESLWIDTVGTLTSLAGGSTAALINSAGAGLLALRPFTVVRTRGFLYLETDQTAASERQALNFGKCVVSDQASIIGVTAVPTPTTDKGSDAWFTFVTIMTSQLAGAIDSQVGIGVAYDSRAMRKVEDGFDLLTVIETEVVALTQGVTLRHTGRTLLKLH